jgi:hypothetical protein
VKASIIPSKIKKLEVFYKPAKNLSQYINMECEHIKDDKLYNH